MSWAEIKQQVRETTTYSRYQAILKVAKQHGLKFEELSDELKNMHSGRSSRTLHIKGTPSAHGLMDAVLQDAAYRSRCVEIINTISVQRRLLEFATTAVKESVVSEFSGELRSIYKTNAERDKALDSLTRSGSKIVADMEVIIEMAHRIMEDIDQSGWAIKNAKELLELINSRGPIVGDA